MEGHDISLFSRRRALMVALSAVASPAVAGAPLTSERPPAGRGRRVYPGGDVLVRNARLSGDVVFAVADAKTGEMLESRNPAKGAAPASVTKAITALYALDVLGPSHRFTTKIVATGTVRDGIIDGDIVLVGGCDPVMDTRDLAALASALKTAGIREVKGNFEVYDGPIPRLRVIDPDQPDHVGYNPGVSGIALNFNRVHFEWKRSGGSYGVTMDARAGNLRPDVTIARMSVVDRRAPVYTYEADGNKDRWTVAKGALGAKGARWLPVRVPGLYAAEVFATLARSHGIVLKSPRLRDTAPTGATLALIESPELSEILKGMLKYSNNLTAEMVGLAATYHRIGTVPDLINSAAEMNRWASEKLTMNAPAFVDHSGLGDRSRVSAQDMVRGLGAIQHSSLLRPLLKPVKLLDSQGRTTNNHPVKAEAKTGTLNFVSGLAGYATSPDGRELVFAIFAADSETRASIPRAARERPPGARTWATRARRLQRQLVARWGTVFVVADG